MTIKAGKTEGGDALLYGTANNPQQGSRPIGWNLLEPENVPVLAELDDTGNPIRIVTPDGQVVNNAAASAAGAVAAEAGAVAAKNAAEAARDATVIGAAPTVYATTAAGLAATTTGQYFSVPTSPASSGYLDLYQNSAGSAVYTNTYPSKGSLAASFNNYALDSDGVVAITPAAITSDSSKLAVYDVGSAYCFQDRYGSLPCTADGQTVGLLVPKTEILGAEMCANGGFTNSTGWTVGAGWAIGSGVATATAASGNLQYATSLDATRWYCVQITATVTSGSLKVNLGAAGTTNEFTITASGTYKVYLLVGGAPTGGIYLKPTGFSGTVDNVSIRAASVYTLMAPSDGERGTYKFNAQGVPYIQLLSGKKLETIAQLTLAAPTYMSWALSKDTQVSSQHLVFLGVGTGSIAFTDASTYTINSVSARSGAFAHIGTRTGVVTLGQPLVMDILLTAGVTSSYVNNGERDVYVSPGLQSGSKRRVANTWTGSDSYTGAKLSVNPGTGAVNIYGGVLYFGSVSDRKRRQVNASLMRTCGLHTMLDYEYDIFAVAGQSNAMGKGDAATSTAPTLGSAIEYVDSGYAKPLQDPTQGAVPNQSALSGSAWPAFAKRYYEVTGRRVCIVGSAYSGEGLINGSISGGTWLNGEFLTDALAFKVRNAQRDFKGRLRGVLYLGGENDATLAFTQAQYEAYLVAFRDKLRKKLNDSSLQLLILSIDESVFAYPQYAVMRAAMENAAANNEGIKLVLPYQGWYAAGKTSDGIHWNQEALNASGVIAADNCAALFTQ